MRGTFLASDGTKVPYYIKGSVHSGKTVVFVHGLIDSADDWSGVIDIISGGIRCVSFDLRGHGRSKAKEGFTAERCAMDLRELIGHLALDGIVLVGFSLGAFILFEYVRMYGCDGLDKIVLEDISPKFINEDGWGLGLYQGEYTRGDFEENMRGHVSEFNGQAAYFAYRNVLMAKPGRRYRSVAPIWARILMLLVVGNSYKRKAAIYLYFKSLCERDHRDTLPLFTAPTAIFFADPGSLFLPETASYMAERIPNGAVLVPFKSASHILILRPAIRFARELLCFIDQ
jgi:pimeloyl-ACP methyl ester carboxylesterase